MISRNIYKAVSVLMALVAAFTVTGLSGCKSRTVPNEVTADYDTPDDYNDERPGVTYGNVDEISYYSPTTGSEVNFSISARPSILNLVKPIR